MTVITGGVVRIEDGLKKSTEFEPARRVAVELRFDVDDGEDDQGKLDTVAAMADTQVKKQLGQSPTAAPSTQSKPSGSTSSKGASKTSSGTSTTASPKPSGKPKPVQSKATLSDLPPEEDDTPASAFDGEPEEAIAAAEEISDTDLHNAAGRKMPELGSPIPIRRLVQSFAPEGHKGPFQLVQIPQAKRGQFLAKLKALEAE